MDGTSHGTTRGYYTQGCRCADCREASRIYYRRLRESAPRHSCAIAGCKKLAIPLGKYCYGHRNRIRLTGSPGPVETIVMNGPDSGYSAAHKMVSRRRGKASEHPCVGCGGKSYGWAFIHGSPNPKPAGPDGSGVMRGPYSLNPDHYQPMCASCHKLYDREAVA